MGLIHYELPGVFKENSLPAVVNGALWLGLESWLNLCLIGIVSVTLFAMFSWHAIEKPVLMQRKRFSRVGARLAAEDTRLTLEEKPATAQ